MFTRCAHCGKIIWWESVTNILGTTYHEFKRPCIKANIQELKDAGEWL